MNCRVRVNDCSIRSSISLSVSESCCNSSRESGTASRAERLLSVMARASSVIRATGASARRPSHRPQTVARTRMNGVDSSRTVVNAPQHAFELALRVGDAQDQRVRADRHLLPGEPQREVRRAARAVTNVEAESLRRPRETRRGARARRDCAISAPSASNTWYSSPSCEISFSRAAISSIPAGLDVLEELAQPDQAVAQPLVQRVIQLGPDGEPVARGGQRTDDRDRAEVPHGQPEPERADVQHSGLRRP